MKYWKALLPLLLFMLAVLLIPVQTEAAPAAVQLVLNGKKLNPEVAPKIVNDSAIVPLRIILEEVGAQVSWLPEGQRIKVEHGKTAIELQIGNTVVSLNGVSMKLDAPPENVNGNTIVPVRFFSESFGLKVSYDDATRTVSLNKQQDESTTTGTGASDNGAGGNSNGSKPGTGTPTGTGKPDPSGTDGKGSSGSGEASSSGAGSSGKDKPTGSVDKDPTNVTLSKLELVGDEVIIQTTGSVSPKMLVLSGPDRIAIDLPGVTLAGSPLAAISPKGGEFAVKHPKITKIRYAQNNDKPMVTRIVVDLSQKSDYKLTEDKATNTIRIQPITKQLKVVIDAGHGGTDPGTKSLNARLEKDFNLAMEAKVIALLKKIPDIEVIETRTDDTYPTLQDRVDLANRLNASLFVSIHGNFFENAAVSGIETYYNRPDSITFANLIHSKLVAASGLPDRRVRNGNLKVIRETTMPAVLLELGYLSNKNDEAQMFSNEFQERTAAAIVASIKEYLISS